MERKDATMRHYGTETRLRLFPMLLVLVIALVAMLVVGNLRADAHIGEEIPQAGRSMSSNLVRNDHLHNNEPAVYTVEPGLLPV